MKKTAGRNVSAGKRVGYHIFERFQFQVAVVFLFSGTGGAARNYRTGRCRYDGMSFAAACINQPAGQYTMDRRHALQVRTQDPLFLKKMVAAILLGGMALGFAVQFVPYFKHAEPAVAARSQDDDGVHWLEQALADPQTSMEDLLGILAVAAMPAVDDDLMMMAPSLDALGALDRQRVENLLSSSDRADQEKAVALALFRSFAFEQPDAQLIAQAQATPPVRYANHALGVFWMQADQINRAAEAFEREGRFPEAIRSRGQAVWAYTLSSNINALRRLGKDPLYQISIPLGAKVKIAAAERDWPTMWRLCARSIWKHLGIGSSLLAGFAGLCWMAFILQAGEVTRPHGARWWLCVVAVLLGMVSIWVTLFLIYWQEAVWGLVDVDEVGRGLRYFVLGVGLREEFSKWLLLLPLIPFLLRRNELEVLIVCACVGLGFAILENEQYFSGDLGMSAVGRFLTANFFHMATTGIVGLATIRAVRYPRTHALEAVVIFGAIVIAHGAYDAFISISALAEYGIASSIIYILLAYLFFHELRSMRTGGPETISLTANFLCGVSLVTAGAFVYLCIHLGFSSAFKALAPEALSMSLMAYMFLREMPNSLISRAG